MLRKDIHGYLRHPQINHCICNLNKQILDCGCFKSSPYENRRGDSMLNIFLLLDTSAAGLKSKAIESSFLFFSKAVPEILVAIRVVMGGPKPLTVLALMVNEYVVPGYNPTKRWCVSFLSLKIFPLWLDRSALGSRDPTALYVICKWRTREGGA